MRNSAFLRRHIIRALVLLATFFIGIAYVMGILGADYIKEHECSGEPYYLPAMITGLFGLVFALIAIIISIKRRHYKLSMLLILFFLLCLVLAILSLLGTSFGNAFCDWTF